MITFIKRSKGLFYIYILQSRTLPESLKMIRSAIIDSRLLSDFPLIIIKHQISLITH